MNTGIYEIVNTVNGKRYVGSSVNLRKRWDGHRFKLRKGAHHSPYMQASWNKYGEASFVFRPLLICDQANLLVYEQILIDGMRPEFNVLQTAGSRLGAKSSKETRDRLSRAVMGHSFNAGIPKTAEHKAKLSAARTGVPNEKNRGNKSRTGMKTDPEIVARQVASLKATWAARKAAGLKPNPEACAKQAESLRVTWARKKAAYAAKD